MSEVGLESLRREGYGFFFWESFILGRWSFGMWVEFCLHFPTLVSGFVGSVGGVFEVFFWVFDVYELEGFHCMDRAGSASWDSMTYNRER